MITSVSVTRTGNTLPMCRQGTRVAVLAVGDHALDVDRAIDHRRDIIGLRRQRDQIRPFFLVQLQRRLLGNSRSARTSATWASHQAVVSLR